MFWKKAKKRKKPVFYDMTDEHGLSYVNMSDAIDYIPVYKGKLIFEDNYEFKFEGNKIFETFSNNTKCAFDRASEIFQRFNELKELMDDINNREREVFNRYISHVDILAKYVTKSANGGK